MPSTSEEEANSSSSKANRTDGILFESVSHSSSTSSLGNESPVPTSNEYSASASAVNQMKCNQPNEILGEALETEAITRLSEVVKKLPSDLQQAMLD